MSIQTPPVAAPRRLQANRPPRIILNPTHVHMHGPGSPPIGVYPHSIPLSAQTASTLHGHGTAGDPQWNTYVNPFQYMYSKKAGEFMSKQLGGIYDFTLSTAKSGMSHGEKSAFFIYEKFSKWSKKWFTHIFLCVVVFAYSALGAAVFQWCEGKQEAAEIEDMRRQRDIFLEEAYNLTLDPRNIQTQALFEGKLITLIHKYKDLLKEPYDMRIRELLDKPRWSFWNSMFYCGTIYTTIGYGHIAPQTMFGRGFTILYAIIGIPIFLILLADFGKLFTRGIKWAWAYVRRLYYTGSCRKVRKTNEVQQMMKGIDLAYDIAIRRPSQFFMGSDEENEDAEKGGAPHTASTQPPLASETPSTPYPETIEIDDEFNLPISLAIFILLLYIFLGAAVYCIWEDWNYFESFYFVFISMSTVGLGDFVPNHPIFMMCSIVYLAFGLALTSMCINVVQTVLSDSFKHATAKIGATMGLTLAEEEAKNSEASNTPGEIPEVHAPKLEKMDTIVEASPTPDKTLTTENNNEDAPPPLLPRKPTTPDPPQPKKPKRFFK